MVFGSIALKHSAFRTLLLIAETSGLLLALLDLLVPSESPLKRITSPARMFLVMNFAAAAAVAVSFIPARLSGSRPE
jgi:hypothetical protein